MILHTLITCQMFLLISFWNCLLLQLNLKVHGLKHGSCNNSVTSLECTYRSIKFSFVQAEFSTSVVWNDKLQFVYQIIGLSSCHMILLLVHFLAFYGILDARQKLVNAHTKHVGESENSISCLPRRCHMDQTIQCILSLQNKSGEMTLTWADLWQFLWLKKSHCACHKRHMHTINSSCHECTGLFLPILNGSRWLWFMRTMSARPMVRADSKKNCKTQLIIIYLAYMNLFMYIHIYMVDIQIYCVHITQFPSLFPVFVF